ncbi:unnamed protein product [Polarella glacialis]|uniref:Bestrophin homolog n=1 Tax=Polarella glacialis TaxID=89957 RepID=A0A813KR13_POLGL|nr:unnamed protein product [Polarella glacialis]CAE8709638.1 unnamed protein product [Polarella glacialis]
MIQYDNSTWAGLLFRYRGTVLEEAWKPVIMVFISCLTVWVFEEEANCQLGAAGKTIFGPTMCYLLVFRAHNASARYWLGCTYVTNIFIAIREFILIMCVATKGGAANQAWRSSHPSLAEMQKLEDVNDIRASMVRVNIIRFGLAFAVSLKLHTRIGYDGYINGSVSGTQKRMIDWDRLRLRGLVSRSEFEEFNDLVPIMHEEHVTKGAPFLTPEMMEDILASSSDRQAWEVDTTPDMRQPLAIIVKLRIEIMKHMNEPWGFKERFSKDFLQLFNQCGLIYEQITVLISTPIPFPYVHLCKVLLLCFLISTPLAMEPNLGFVASVMLPTFVALSLLGIDAIAQELENPFGDKANHLDVDSSISALEDECMLLLDLCGDWRARQAFRSLDIPEVILNGSVPKDVGKKESEDELFLQDELFSNRPKFVCLRSQIRTDDDTPPASMDELPAMEGHLNRKKAHVRTSFDVPEGSQDDSKMPLLPPGAGGSEVGFKPMKEFGTETLIFEEGGGREAAAEDFVGLDFHEDEDELEMQVMADQQSSAGEMDPVSPGATSRGSADLSLRGSAEFSAELAPMHLTESQGEEESSDVSGLSEGESEEDGKDQMSVELRNLLA